jgi:RHS repeat-associated protein
VTSFIHDPNGNLLGLVDVLAHTTAYTYEAMDRAATRAGPLGRAESTGYDLNGNVTTATDRAGQGTSTTYDALDRRTQVMFADGSSTAFTWDTGDRPTPVVDSLIVTITRTYDGLDRPTQEVTPQGTVSYTYDAAGRRTRMTVAGQPAVTFTYDNADRLTAIAQGTQTVSIAYDAASRRTALTLPNGVVTEHAYDAASRLTQLTYRQGATILGTLTYAYDAGGQRIGVGGTWARTALPPALAGTTYDAANQQRTFGSAPLTYDLNGNRTGDGTTTYTWDARNQLASVSGPSTTAAFQYDALGRRTRKTIDSTTTDFLYDGLNPIQEARTTGITTLLTGLGIGEYLTRTDAAGTRNVLTDALGSTVALTDTAGVVGTQYTYEPFGETAVTGTPDASEFQYTGRENDNTGLYYYRARYYHPQLQRFISEEPWRFLGGDPNLYAYVFNNPTNDTDPLGLYPPWLASALKVAAIVLGFGLSSGTPEPGPTPPGYGPQQPGTGVDTHNVPRPGPPRQPGPNPLQNPLNPSPPTAPPGGGGGGARPPGPGSELPVLLLPTLGPPLAAIGAALIIILWPTPLNGGEDAWCAMNRQSCGGQGSKSNR